MRGARKRRVGCRRVADLGVERDVVGHVIPETRRGRFDCLRGKRHRRQRFPRNVDQLGGVLGGRERVGHHHRNGFAGKAGAIRRQQDLLGGEPLAAVAVAQRHVGTHVRAADRVRDRLEACVRDVGAGVDRKNAGRSARRRNVD